MYEQFHTLDSLHLWHARNAFRLLLPLPSLVNDRIPCMTLKFFFFEQDLAVKEAVCV